MKLIPEEWESYISDREYLLSLIKPHFIRKNGVIILKSHYDSEIFRTKWMPFIYNHLNEIARLENTINHVHLGDIAENSEIQKIIGEYLSRIWRQKLKSQFPKLRFEIKLVLDSNAKWELQLWTKRN